MNLKNLSAFLCSAIGAGLSLWQTVLSMPSLYLELSFLDLMFLHNNELFTASCVVMAVAVFAAICGLCALLRIGKAFYVWGLAGCSLIYIAAICIYTSNLQAGEAVKSTFQAWHKTYLVWAVCFFMAALFAFLDYKSFTQQDSDASPDSNQPEYEQAFTPPNASPAPADSSDDPFRKMDSSALLAQAYTFLSEGNFREAERYYREALKHNHENSAAYLGQLMAKLRVRNIDELRSANIPLAENSLFRLAMLFANDDQRAVLQKCLDSRT